MALYGGEAGGSVAPMSICLRSRVGLALAMVASVAEGAAPAFRVRADVTAGLNADAGWAAGVNEEAVVQADRPFRVRFEAERGAVTAGAPGLVIQYRRNGDEDWIETGAFDFPYPKGEEPRSPRVSVVRTPAYADGAPTRDLLPGSTEPSRGGVGVNLAAQAPAWFAGEGGQLEYEWPLVIRRFVDGAETNEDGDRFEFRLSDGLGHALPGATVAAVRLEVPAGHVGGTFVETPGRIGPWQAGNGDLYFIMDPAESSNLFMMVKSSDGGRSWAEVDAANRPETDDLESVDGRVVGDTIEIVHQVTRRVVRHVFRTSDHPTAPDTWAVTDEVGPTVRSVAQAVTMARRSDGSMVVFFVGETLRHSVRSPNGQWSESEVVERGAAPLLAGPQAVRGADDAVHVAYYGADGTAWFRTLAADGTLSAAVQLDDAIGEGRDAYGAVLPLVYLPESDTVVVVHQRADLRLWERRITAGGAPTPAVAVSDRPVVREAADSQQPGADLVAMGDALHVLFIDDETREIFSVRATGDGTWSAPTRRVGGVRADWVRGAAHASPDGGYVVRFVYDGGSGGGAGMNRYAEFKAGANND